MEVPVGFGSVGCMKLGGPVGLETPCTSLERMGTTRVWL